MADISTTHQVPKVNGRNVALNCGPQGPKNVPGQVENFDFFQDFFL